MVTALQKSTRGFDSGLARLGSVGCGREFAHLENKHTGQVGILFTTLLITAPLLGNQPLHSWLREKICQNLD